MSGFTPPGQLSLTQGGHDEHQHNAPERPAGVLSEQMDHWRSPGDRGRYLR